jgi:hypothetical protein
MWWANFVVHPVNWLVHDARHQLDVLEALRSLVWQQSLLTTLDYQTGPVV